MVRQLVHGFANERQPQYNVQFRLERPSDPGVLNTAWKAKYINVEPISSEPADFRAYQLPHPTHPVITRFNVPDLLVASEIPVVCDEFKKIVEALEPNRHQFLEVSVLDNEQNRIPKAYWLMNVLQRSDCLVRREQIKEWEASGHVFPEIELFWRDNPRARRALTPYVNKAKLEGLHLWRPIHPEFLSQRSMYLFDFFISDELVRQVEEAKLQKMNTRLAIELDVPIQQ